MPAGEAAARPELAHAVLTSCNRGYVRWLEHLQRNLLHLRMDQLCTVCAMDEETARAARRLRLRAIATHHGASRLAGASGVGSTFMSAEYRGIVQAKARCVQEYLAQPDVARTLAPSRVASAERGARAAPLLLFVDTDVTLFADPFGAMPPAADIALLDDTGPTQKTKNIYNSGFFMMRLSAPTAALWSAMVEYHARSPATLDQPALNRLLGVPSDAPTPRGTKSFAGDLTAALLPAAAFLNGWRFYEDRPGAASAAPERVVAVHHNWISGDESKWLRATEFDALVTDPTETREAFLARTRASMRTRPKWVYVRPGSRRAQSSRLQRATRNSSPLTSPLVVAAPPGGSPNATALGPAGGGAALLRHNLHGRSWSVPLVRLENGGRAYHAPCLHAVVSARPAQRPPARAQASATCSGTRGSSEPLTR